MPEHNVTISHGFNGLAETYIQRLILEQTRLGDEGGRLEQGGGSQDSLMRSEGGTCL